MIKTIVKRPLYKVPHGVKCSIGLEYPLPLQRHGVYEVIAWTDIKL